MANEWINATIEDDKGEIDVYQFNKEYEVKYFLSCNENYKLLKLEYHKC